MELVSVPTKKKTLVKSTDLSKEDKVKLIKKHAEQEMKTFQDLTQKYFDQLDKLALFEGISVQARTLLVDEYYHNILEPVINGRRIPGLSQEQFNDMRKDFFRTLVNKYGGDQ